MDGRVYLDNKVQDLLFDISQTVGYAQSNITTARDRAANHQHNPLFDRDNPMFIENCRTDFSEVPQGKISNRKAELYFYNDTENSRLEIPVTEGNFYPSDINYTVTNFDGNKVTIIKIDASQDGLYIRDVVKSHINPENVYETTDLKIYTDKSSLLEANALLDRELPNLRIHHETAERLKDNSGFSASVEDYHNTIAYTYNKGYDSGTFTGGSIGLSAGILLVLLANRGHSMYRSYQNRKDHRKKEI